MRAILVVAFAAYIGAASAQSTTFRIAQVYSNLDGSVQFVELTESAGLDGQHRLAGLTLTSSRNGAVERFTFTHDLPSEKTARLSIVVSSDWLRIDSQSWIPPDVLGLPPRFLAIDGGTLDFAGVDRVSYAALPTDGVAALYRGGEVRESSVPTNGRCRSPCAARARHVESAVYAVEYHHADLDHYFISASAADIHALDSGRLSGWKRTGGILHVGARRGAAGILDHPVCRLYLPPASGDSHFFSVSEDECRIVRERFPLSIVENDASFYAAVPDPATGSCNSTPVWPATDLTTFSCPVYRLWNGRSDSNHRYTGNPRVRREMIDRGWISEGFGSDGVSMCVPAWALWDDCGGYVRTD